MATPITFAPPGGFGPGRLWSLWDMQNLHLASLLHLITSATATRYSADGGAEKIGSSIKKFMTTNLVSDSKGLVEIGFGASFATIQKMATIAGKPGARFDDIAEVCEELVGRLKDEALAQKFFSLTLKESDFYLNATRGWEKAIERFPSIIDDVEEASKCYALSRYPAAVFHSVQIIEHGLLDLGKFLKVTDPHSGWTAVTNALKKVVDKKYQDRTKFEKQNYEFLEQLHGLVQGLKNAWRNKISHAHGRMIVISKEFSPEIAEEILIATRALMRRLADGLPPPKTGRVPKAGGAS